LLLSLAFFRCTLRGGLTGAWYWNIEIKKHRHRSVMVTVTHTKVTVY
jgi:hypothetical protein